MSDLLTHAAIRASCDPCQMPRREMLDLVAAAGLAGSELETVIGDHDPVLTQRAVVLQLVELAAARG